MQRELLPITVVGTRSGNSPELKTLPEAASQTFKKGEGVYIDGSGHIAEFTATADDGTARLYGFAAEDAHNDGVAAHSNVAVYVANDDTIFEGNIYHTTIGSAVTAQTDLGTLLPLKQLTAVAGGINAIDKENTAGQIDCARIIGFSKSNDIGDTYGRVRFVIEAAGRAVRQ